MKAIDIYNDVEYLHITKANKTLLQFTGKDINGKRKSEIQSLIGLKLGENRFNYSLKLMNDGKIYRGTIRAFIPDNQKTEKDNINFDQIKINELEKQLKEVKEKEMSFDFDKILNMQEKIYKTQIDFISKQMEIQNKQIEQLQKNQSDSSGFDLSSLILPLIMKKGQATMNLKDNATGNNYELPDSLINVVSKIDYSKLTQDQIESLSKQLDKLIDLAGVPKKEGK